MLWAKSNWEPNLSAMNASKFRSSHLTQIQFVLFCLCLATPIVAPKVCGADSAPQTDKTWFEAN